MFTFSFTLEQVNTLLKSLDHQPHGAVRGLIDFILTETTRQQEEFKAKQQPAGGGA